MSDERRVVRIFACAALALVAVSPLTAAAQPTFGGGGGNPGVITCPRIVGFYGRSGRFVDALGLICEDSQGNRYDTPRAGGGGGQSFRSYCPSGFAVGITGRSGRFIDALRLTCQGGTTFRAGGGGGGPFEYPCPGGQLLRGFNLRAGRYIDALQPLCQ